MKTINSIESDEELDMALAVLGDLDAEVLRAEADLDQALAETRRGFEDRFKVKLESDEMVTYAEVRSKLVDLVQEYCEINRRELLVGDKKSVDLVHGVIGWRKSRDAVAELELDEKAKKAGLLTKCYEQVVSLVATLAAKLGKLPISNFITVKVTWNKSKVLEAVNDGKVTAAQLAKQGLEVQRGIDQFYCEPRSQKRPA